MKTKRLIKGIYNYLNQNFNGEDVELSVCIAEHIANICDVNGFDSDEYEYILDTYTDNIAVLYSSELIPEFSELCSGNNNRLSIRKFEGIYYLCLNEYAKNYDNSLVDKYCDLLQKLCEMENKQYSSEAYEEFCQKWFSEFCKEVHTTPKSNDKGVDLIGVLKSSSLPDSITANNEIRMVAQVKLYDHTVDTPIIRRLLGDVVFLTFDDSDICVFAPTVLVVIGHKGFTKAATEFAKKYNVVLLDSRDLIRILSFMGDLESFSCIKYLNSLKND